MSRQKQSGPRNSAGKPKFVYEIYKFTPPDHHELVAEVSHPGVAEWKVYQLDTLLSAEDRRKGIFHYRWLRINPA